MAAQTELSPEGFLGSLYKQIAEKFKDKGIEILDLESGIFPKWGAYLPYRPGVYDLDAARSCIIHEEQRDIAMVLGKPIRAIHEADKYLILQVASLPGRTDSLPEIFNDPQNTTWGEVVWSSAPGFFGIRIRTGEDPKFRRLTEQLNQVGVEAYLEEIMGVMNYTNR